MAESDSLVQQLVGVWRIARAIARTPAGDEDARSLLELQFELTADFDLVWTPVESASPSAKALVACDVYQVWPLSGQSYYQMMLRFASFDGHFIEFYVCEVRDASLVLRSKINWVALVCQKSDEGPRTKSNLGFSLLPALEQSLFTDLEISSKNSRKFSVHSVLLQKFLKPDGMAEAFKQLDGTVLDVLLHFLYSRTFPITVEVPTLDALILWLSSDNGFVKQPWLQKCKEEANNFLLCSNMAREVSGLIKAIFGSLNKLIVAFSGNPFQCPIEPPEEEPLLAEQRVLHMYRLILRTVLSAALRIILVLSKFGDTKSKMSIEQREAFVDYVQSCIPIIMGQLTRLLSAIAHRTEGMSQQEYETFNGCLGPLFEDCLGPARNLLSGIAGLAKEAIEKMEERKAQTSSPQSNITQELSFARYSSLEWIEKQASIVSRLIAMGRDALIHFANAQGVAMAAPGVQTVVDQIPLQRLKLRQINNLIQNWIQQKSSFKAHFYATSASTLMVLSLIQKCRSTRSFVSELVQLSHHSDVTVSLLRQIGLWDQEENVLDCNTEDQEYFEGDCELDLRKFQPNVGNVSLADHCGTLQDDETGADLSIVVGDVEFKCHRFVLAARSKYFRQQLTSGMKEAIERRIEVGDGCPATFKLLLSFLYSSALPCTLTAEEYSKLLLLSDYYEIGELKSQCEEALCKYNDIKSTMEMLSLADETNSTKLKTSCIAMFLAHPETMLGAEFEALSQPLKNELLELSTWGQCDEAFLGKPKDMVSGKMAGLNNERSEAESIDWSSRCYAMLCDIVGDRVSKKELNGALQNSGHNLCTAINLTFDRL